MKIKLIDKCCMRFPTNIKGWDDVLVKKLNKEIYLNNRVIRRTGYLNHKDLYQVSDEPTITPDGILYKYICPVCGSEMLLLKEESYAPYKTCYRCRTDEKILLYEKEPDLTAVWVELIAQNYDPLDTGTMTASGKVCKKWLDPLNFVTDILKKFDINGLRTKSRLERKALIMTCVGEQWDLSKINIFIEGERDLKDEKYIKFYL